MSEDFDNMATTDKLLVIEHRLTRIETKLDDLCLASKTWGNRAWGVLKAVVLVTVGYLLHTSK